MDVVEAFVVTLGIDPRDYKREIKAYRDDRKRLAEEDAKYNRDAQDSQKRLVSGFRTLRNEAAGFLFLLAGANSVKDFTANLIAGDAATGRLAKNLGLATEEVSAWEGAIKRVGGSASDIQNSLRAMSSAFQSLQLTGTTGNDADFQGLGLRSTDLQNPTTALLKIADASGRMGRPEFNARLSRLGFDENSINLLARGRAEVSRMLEEQRKLGVVTEQDTLAAQRFQEQLAMIESAIKGKLRPEIERVVTVLGNWLITGNNLNNVLFASEAILIGVGVAAAGALGPLGLLASAVGFLALKFVDLNEASAAWKILGLRADKFYAEAQAQQFSKSDPKLAGEYLQRAADDADSIMRITESVEAGRRIRATGTGGAPRSLGGGRTAYPTTNSVLSTGTGGTDPEIYRVLAAKYGPQVARGITAGIKAEGGSLGMAANGAFGIGQWRGGRQRELLRRYGRTPTKAQQLEFLMWELEGGDRGGAGVLSSKTDEEALSNYIGGVSWGFMRPGIAGRAGDMTRGLAALGRNGASRYAGAAGGGQTTQTTSVGQIIVYTAATDAEGIANDMRGALAKRGLVVQANTGLQP